MIFHTHSWKEEARWYTPPNRGPFEASRISEETIEKIMFGVTSVELRCSVCGDLKCVVLPGDARSNKQLVIK